MGSSRDAYADREEDIRLSERQRIADSPEYQEVLRKKGVYENLSHSALPLGLSLNELRFILENPRDGADWYGQFAIDKAFYTQDRLDRMEAIVNRAH